MLSGCRYRLLHITLVWYPHLCRIHAALRRPVGFSLHSAGCSTDGTGCFLCCGRCCKRTAGSSVSAGRRKALTHGASAGGHNGYAFCLVVNDDHAACNKHCAVCYAYVGYAYMRLLYGWVLRSYIAVVHGAGPAPVGQRRCCWANDNAGSAAVLDSATLSSAAKLRVCVRLYHATWRYLIKDSIGGTLFVILLSPVLFDAVSRWQACAGAVEYSASLPPGFLPTCARIYRTPGGGDSQLERLRRCQSDLHAWRDIAWAGRAGLRTRIFLPGWLVREERFASCCASLFWRVLLHWRRTTLFGHCLPSAFSFC